MPNHFHCNVLAFDEIKKDWKSLDKPVSISFLNFETEKSAMEIAKNLVKRKHYQLNAITQCAGCNYARELIDTLKNHG